MNKIAFITGATAGIGEASAHRFASHGWNLILTGRRAERLDQLKATLVASYNIDRAAVENAWNSLSEPWQRVDLLLNNAGLALDKSPLPENNPDDWDTMIDTNVKGLLYMTRMVMPTMIARKSGHIINLGSVAGREVYPGGAVYCASKYAVEGLSRAMRLDLLQHKIRVTSISPGLVETEFSVVRFKGDEAKAEAVYQGYDPLVAKDIAECVYWAASQPPHVCINDIALTCTAQGDSRSLHKEG
ncbi:UNVERIFIED_CONTAM: hypothetical protein GTU68_051192 [Idotea baltica]|nr:hypothetical protein [Idotea baltica]